MKPTRGITLIELLTVIAIIAILSAIILPVLARAKDSAYRGGDIQHMNELRTALQLYRADNGAYPPAILGYASVYMTGANMGQIIPANLYPGHLYSKRVPSLESFRPAYDRVDPSAVTMALWPNQDPRAAGTAPALDLDGDGDIDAADDPANARQAFGPATTVLAESPLPASPCAGGAAAVEACFYRISGYDVAEERVPGSGVTRTTLRYSRFWSSWGLGGGNAMDDPRQLGYDNPPENTVITWNGYFRDYSSGDVSHTKKDIVLFLSGAARTYDSKDAFERSWRVLP